MLLDLLLENAVFIGITIGLLSILSLIIERLSVHLYQRKYGEIVVYERLTTSRCCNINIEKFITPIELVSRVIIAGVAVIFFHMLYNNELPISSLPPATVTFLVEIGVGGIILAYVTNLVIDIEEIIKFLYIINNPTSLSGKLTIRENFSFISSTTKHIIIGTIWLLIFILVEELFFLGGFIYELHRLSKLRQLY